MKRQLLGLAIVCGTTNIIAGTVFGNGGATEVTQIMNNVQLILQYEQQVQAYLRQGLQLQSELKNLEQNPTSLLGQDVGNLINGVGKIIGGGQSIGYSLATIDRNFAATFKSPTAQTLSDRFSSWHKTSTDTLEGALKAAGLHRDQFNTDTEALTALYNESQAADGNLKAIQSLSKINSMQVQQLQKLQDLMATQNIASSTYMAAKTAKDQELLDMNQRYSIPQYEMPKKPSKSKY